MKEPTPQQENQYDASKEGKTIREKMEDKLMKKSSFTSQADRTIILGLCVKYGLPNRDIPLAENNLEIDFKKDVEDLVDDLEALFKEELEPLRQLERLIENRNTLIKPMKTKPKKKDKTIGDLRKIWRKEINAKMKKDKPISPDGENGQCKPAEDWEKGFGEELSKCVDIGISVGIVNYEPLVDFVKTLLDKEREKAFEAQDNAWSATRILWDRMNDWNKEWQKENLKERKLTYQDAIKLIEWKIDQARKEGYEEGMRDGIDSALTAESELKEKEDNKIRQEGYDIGWEIAEKWGRKCGNKEGYEKAVKDIELGKKMTRAKMLPSDFEKTIRQEEAEKICQQERNIGYSEGYSHGFLKKTLEAGKVWQDRVRQEERSRVLGEIEKWAEENIIYPSELGCVVVEMVTLKSLKEIIKKIK